MSNKRAQLDLSIITLRGQGYLVVPGLKSPGLRVICGLGTDHSEDRMYLHMCNQSSQIDCFQTVDYGYY
jgi:hypothetical protein